MRNIGIVILATFSAWSCASTTHTPPFDRESASGITFWEISPADDSYVYSFHWVDETLSVARQVESGIEHHDLPLNSCPLLEAYLIQFRESVLDSVKIVFVREPAIPVIEEMSGGPLYRARYAPDRFSTFVQLEGTESGKVPWIAAARKVSARASACVDNPQDARIRE